MRDHDKKTFGTELAKAMSFYEKALKASQLELWFELLAPYSLENCLGAIKAHMAHPKNGKFAPKPADLIEQIEGAQPSAMTGNEAWAIALQGRDEAATVLTNNLIDHAMSACQSILDLGDKIGARMAFLAAYERAVAAGVSPVWRVSLGYDIAGRAEVVQNAFRLGLISKDQAAQMLPAPEPTSDGAAIAGLITGRAGTPSASNRERWHKLAADFRAKVAADEQRRAAAREAQAEAFEARRQAQLQAIGLQAGVA